MYNLSLQLLLLSGLVAGKRSDQGCRTWVRKLVITFRHWLSNTRPPWDGGDKAGQVTGGAHKVRRLFQFPTRPQPNTGGQEELVIPLLPPSLPLNSSSNLLLHSYALLKSKSVPLRYWRGDRGTGLLKTKMGLKF